MTTDTKKPRLFILLFIVILAAIAVGYGTTKFQNHNSDKSLPLGSPPKLTEEEKRQKNAIQKADYIISRPSQGSLIQKQRIKLQYKPGGNASAHLPNKYSGKIRRYQAVILYDKSETIMPLGGKIKSITPNGAQLEIEITLPEGTKTEYLSHKADILTLDANSSLRFPLTALKQDKNDNYYVWLAEKTDKAGLFKTNQVWIKSPLIGEQNFVAGNNISVNSFLILEPNKKTKHGKTYKMVEVEYKFPRHNPIKQAYYDYHAQKRATESVNAKQRLADCRKNAQKKKYDVAGGQSGSCGGNSPAGKTDPMDIFNSILSRQPAGALGSCGAASCGEQ